jgi:phytoene synthase
MDLEQDGAPDDAALRRYLQGSEGGLFRVAGQVLGAEPAPELDAASSRAGEAYGMTRLLLALPQALSRGRMPLPLTELEAAGLTRQGFQGGAASEKLGNLLAKIRADARASLALCRQCVAELPRPAGPAFLPLAMVEPYLRALEQPGHDPVHRSVELSPLSRIIRIAAAHWLGRI